MLDSMMTFGDEKPGSDGVEANARLWLIYDIEDKPIAVAHCAPEYMAEGTFNLLLIAVHPRQQGSGIGAALVQHVEAELVKRSARVLLVETSSSETFSRTRSFYCKKGFEEEATIRDFYSDGEDKIVFWKNLKTNQNK